MHRVRDQRERIRHKAEDDFSDHEGDVQGNTGRERAAQAGAARVAAVRVGVVVRVGMRMHANLARASWQFKR